jgi:hypothetical protein
LKKYFWGVLILGIVISLLAVWMDWSGSGIKLAHSPTSTPELQSGSDQALQSCDTNGESHSGPLVPDQDTPNPLTPLQAITPTGEISPGLRSSRAGFSISTSTDPAYWADMLGASWYMDWSMKDTGQDAGPQHWQMVRVHENCISPSPEAIRAAAMKYTGQVWIIGNEPDVIWQDNVTPTRYAISYHALYNLVKSADPSALLAVGGISQSTPLRLQYLDQVLQVYHDLYHQPLPADWWTVHGYVLREEKGSWGVEIPPGIDATQGELYAVSDHGRIDLFQQQLIAFRHWMKANGYQQTPLALTEFGILMPTSYGFPYETIASYLEQTFTWLYQARDETTGDPADAYHLIQKWAWFSISDPQYPSSNLGDLSTGNLTLVGERFRIVVSTKGR